MQRALSLLNENQQSFGGPKKRKEYEVEEIVSAEKKNGRMMFMVKWKGYDKTKNTLQSKADLKNSQAALQDYMDSERIIDVQIVNGQEQYTVKLKGFAEPRKMTRLPDALFERIVNARRVNGQEQYLVKLKGLTEPREMMRGSVPDVLFEAWSAPKRPREGEEDPPGSSSRPRVTGHAQSPIRPITTTSTIQTASQEISVRRVGTDYFVYVGSRKLSLEEYMHEDAMNLFVYFIDDMRQDEVQVRIRTHSASKYEVILYRTNPVTIIASYNFDHRIVCSNRSFEDVLKAYCRSYKQSSFKETLGRSNNVLMRPGDEDNENPVTLHMLFKKSLDDMLVTKAVVVMTIKNCISNISQIWRLEKIDDEHFLWSQNTEKLNTDSGNTSHTAGDKLELEMEKSRLQSKRAIARAEKNQQSVQDITMQITNIEGIIASLAWTPPIHIPWRRYTKQFLTDKSTEPKLDLHDYCLFPPEDNSKDQDIYVRFKYTSEKRQRLAPQVIPAHIDWLVRNEYATIAGSSSVFMKISVSVTNMYKEGEKTCFELEQDVGSSSSSRRPIKFRMIPMECVPANKIFMYFMKNGELYDVVQRRKGTSFEHVVVQAKKADQAGVKYTYEFSNSILSNDRVKAGVMSIVSNVREINSDDEKTIMDAMDTKNLDEVVRLLKPGII